MPSFPLPNAHDSYHTMYSNLVATGYMGHTVQTRGKCYAIPSSRENSTTDTSRIVTDFIKTAHSSAEQMWRDLLSK